MRLPRILSRWVVAAVMAVASTNTGVAAAQNTDPGAGNWRMIVLNGPTHFAVPAPGSTTGIDYQAELNAIRAAQSRITPQQRKAIDYWSRGGVVRWNEILLALVARYNLPPAPNAANTYP
ncbi:MAG TPA: hypothetical protein VFS23_06840, partial [Vicinamibacterales bacterium]|nr:hypothetical protein [Vicinamibacterales bacterium]